MWFPWPDKRFGTSFFWDFADPETWRQPRKEVLVRCKYNPLSRVGRRRTARFMEDPVTALSSQDVLGCVKSLCKKLYKIQLCIKCLSREINLFRGEDVPSASRLPTGCWSVCSVFPILVFSWKEQMEQ